MKQQPSIERIRVSSRDVAKLAGVSQATVSRVLNDFSHVNPKTRARVEAAMRELNYRPSAAARSLMTQRTNLIGLVVSNITNAFYPEIIEAICDRALAADRTIILGSTAESGDRQAALLDLLAEQRVDGAILTSAFIGGEKRIEPLIRHGFPLVLANRVNERLDVDSVAIDNRDGARVAVRHLFNTGRRSIAFIGGRVDTATNRDKHQGYLDALEELDVEVDDALTRNGDYTYEHGYRAVQHLIALGRSFDAILAADDTIALGCMDAIIDAKLSIPRDVAVIGFDDIRVASLRAVSLSTVSSQPARMGELAIELLLDRIEGRYKGNARQILLPAELIVRRSSAASD